MTERIGILAYGSVINDPGPEIAAATAEITLGVITPFRIEFARSSVGRNGAPTLVPVEQGGATVTAVIYQVDAMKQDAKDILYRREINRVGSDRRYREPALHNDNAVYIDSITDFAGYDLVLYTRIAANVVPMTADHLADLALKSARDNKDGRDGITYLIAAKANGIVTPLMAPYEAEILHRTGASDLAEAALAVKRSRMP